MPRGERGKAPSTLGKSLVNKQKSLRWRRLANQTYAGQHVTEAEAPIAGSGIKGQKGALQSVTDRRELDEFLVEAMLQEEQFEAEHSSMVILSTEAVAKKEYDALKANNFEYPEIPIPRRPEWDEETTPDQLDRMEKDSFLRWRKSLADMEEEFNGKEITPFEKNLEVWKQLWRVIERSRIIIQIVDGRNPLLYRSLDLERYVSEVAERTGKHKTCLLLINKADFLTPLARKYWVRYFREKGIDTVFWSAALEQQRLDRAEKKRKKMLEKLAQGKKRPEAYDLSESEDEEEDDETTQQQEVKQTEEEGEEDDEEYEDDEEEYEDEEEEYEDDEEETTTATEEKKQSSKGRKSRSTDESELIDETTGLSLEDLEHAVPQSLAERRLLKKKIKQVKEMELKRKLRPSKHHAHFKRANIVSTAASNASEEEAARLLTRDQLLDYILAKYQADKKEHKRLRQERGEDVDDDEEDEDEQDPNQRINIGMVGYPNVGKSSTINVLMGEKKVTVSATPGKTKHFQTLNIPETVITLCDCPGLVFPTFTSTRAELAIHGIMPIDQIKDFRNTYLPVQLICNKVSREQLMHTYSLGFPEYKPVDAPDLLIAYSRMRNFNKDHGRPDEQRAARIMLKDFVNGKILYCHPPPALSDKERREFYESFRLYVDAADSVGVNMINPELYAQSHQSTTGAATSTSSAGHDDEDDEDDEHEHDEDDSKSSQPKLKFNKLVLQAAIQDDLDNAVLPTSFKANNAPNKNADGSELTKKQLRRLEQRPRKKGGKANKSRKHEVPMDEVGVKINGKSIDVASRNGVAQLSMPFLKR